MRLLTLLGPGGIGKTRLALQAAADRSLRFDGGVYLVDLAAARSPGDVLQAIVEAVGVELAADADLRDALAAELGPRRLLLLLDNFEQVVDAAEDVAVLLQRCPQLKLLVTSREALGIRGEQTFAVEPLALPARRTATADEAARSAAVRLFVDRARQARPDFVLTDANAEVVAEICARLDGLPLAIELAAARLRLLSPTELRDRLRSRLDLLRGGARDLPARHQTLQRTIEWSYELLDEEERSVFELLSLFPSARIEAVEHVAGGLEHLAGLDVVDRLGSLVDKSLVRASEDDGETRLSMLGTIREYADARLRGDPALHLAASRGHAAYFAELAAAERGDLDALGGRGRQPPGRVEVLRRSGRGGAAVRAPPGALAALRGPRLVPRRRRAVERAARGARAERARARPRRRGGDAAARRRAGAARPPRLHRGGRAPLPGGARDRRARRRTARRSSRC